MRRIKALMLGVVLALAFVPTTGAQAFCGPDEGCSPCGAEVVIQGKNTRVEWHQC